MIIAGTGHRPDKLGGYSKQVFDDLVYLATIGLKKYQPTLVISGMALGWDQALAQAAVDLGHPFHAYIPFEGQESRWPKDSQSSFKSLISKAAHVEVCSPGGYSARAMQVRNERMVDDCDMLLALWNGTSGGTANCIRYATQKERKLINAWSAWQKLTTT